MQNITKSCPVRARVGEGLKGLICMRVGSSGSQEGLLYWKMDANCAPNRIGCDNHMWQGRLRLPENQGNAANCADDLESQMA